MGECAIGLIFRIPEKGKVKKRLSTKIGEERAFNFYNLMLCETLNNLNQLEKIDIFGFYKGNISLLEDSLSSFFPIPLEESIKVKEFLEQKGSDLGEIIINVMAALKDRGYKKVIVIGSDYPSLPREYIVDANRYLEDHDIVIGPTEDGGFYLLGCKKIYPDVFQGIEWGSERVFSRLQKNIVDKNLACFILPCWYDIDRVEDLERWIERRDLLSLIE